MEGEGKGVGWSEGGRSRVEGESEGRGLREKVNEQG
jgi:hypothetical protein